MSDASAPTTMKAPPWSNACDKVIAAYKAGEDIVVLQCFEELRAMPELNGLVSSQVSSKCDAACRSSETTTKDEDGKAAELERLEFCWGRALLSARRTSGDDDEHIASIVEGFEQQFGIISEYLRALAIGADSALRVLQVYHVTEGPMTAKVIAAALHRFPTADASRVRELLQFLETNSVSVTREVREQLEKNFVIRMKTEDAEEVFKEMREAGVEPVSTHPYNFIFMKTPPFKYMELLEYYEDMLDRGIVPMNSTFRILCKQTQNTGIVNQHFAALLRTNAVSCGENDEAERGGTQVFFATRLEELARLKPDTSLDDALRVFRRMDVEGTPLVNGSSVLSALLSFFCRPGHMEDTERVLRTAREHGCHANSATLSRVLKSSNPDRFLQAELIIPDTLNTDGVKPCDFTDVMCHFFTNNMRSEALRILRAYVHHWYRNPEEVIPSTVVVWALKFGPFDWSLGVLAILLASADRPLCDRIQRRMHEVGKEGRGREIIRVLEDHKWDRCRILLEPQLQDQPNIKGSGADINGSRSEAGNGPSAHHRRDSGLSWMSAMHLALKEMGVEKEVLVGWKSRLSAAMDEAGKRVAELECANAA